MIVSAASRMLRAISLGVLCRLGALDQGNHAVQETLARVGGNPHDQPVRQRPRTARHSRAIPAGFADHRGTLPGDRTFVDAGNALDDLTVAGDDLARLDQHHVAPAPLRGGDRLHVRVAPRPSQLPRS